MKYFKIVYGFNQDEYLEIDENELAKAIAIFMQGNGRASFHSGAVRGQDIMRIIPDWHTTMGWNKGHKMTSDDHAEVKRFEIIYRDTYNTAKMLAEYATKANKPELLSIPLADAVKQIPQSESRNMTIEGTDTLAKQMKVV